ncbi:LuxR C-terminal-related transcriptional regulator [Nitratireductor sp. StC3]|uniref:helix-turn-helix transcriptional regulator n=1 Tax=Nitratireductor sp. StC3 TaxID=2126741 RepID=UPI0011B2602E|nr:LuxR C-terminal-related transcriptional regulator [Nitratireductor sp. StC3]
MTQAALISASMGWTAFRERMERVVGPMEAYDLLMELTRDAGYRHFAVLTARSGADTALPYQVVLTSLSHSSVREYQELDAASGDKTLVEALRGGRPFFWDRRTPAPLSARAADAGNDNRATDGLLSRLGIRTGLGLPVFRARAPHGFALFGGERPVPDIGQAAHLSFWCNGIYERMARFEQSQRDRPRSRLTARELQCLSWTSAGKTSVEIAAILGLSEHTVNQYIASSSQKLGTVNRTQAVAEAIRLRLID